jgi:hypothetical protein
LAPKEIIISDTMRGTEWWTGIRDENGHEY